MNGEFFEDGAELLGHQLNQLRNSSGLLKEIEGGSPDGVFSQGFSSTPRARMYQAWVMPDLYPDERQPVLKNWSDEDLEAYCGIYDRKAIGV